MAALEDGVIDTATVVDTGKGRLYIHGKKVEDSERRIWRNICRTSF